MTNPSETRDSELVPRGAALKARVLALPEDAPNMDIIADLAEWAADCYDYALAADTIDRLTSTGEAVAFEGVAKRKLDDLLARGWAINGYAISKDGEQGLVTTGSLVGWWSVAVENARKAELALEEARAASPREGHVEVPVEGLDRDELLGITEYLMMQADIDTPDDTEPDCDDLCGNRVCAAVGCVVRKFRRVRVALPHNQRGTKP